jgi:hypothetical protein
MILIEHAVKNLWIAVAGAAQPLIVTCNSIHLDKEFDRAYYSSEISVHSTGESLVLAPPSMRYKNREVDRNHPHYVPSVLVMNPGASQAIIDFKIKIINPETNQVLSSSTIARRTLSPGSSNVIPFLI